MTRRSTNWSTDLSDLNGKTVLVMGLGAHGGGAATARYCAEAGASVTVTDLGSELDLTESLSALSDLPIRYVLGEHREEDFTSADLVLVGPRMDLTFTENLFFTTFVQYNNQVNNLNVNMRFQWRFAPVSDLFIVYTENSYPDGLRTKDRGIVVKLSYWIN